MGWGGAPLVVREPAGSIRGCTQADDSHMNAGRLLVHGLMPSQSSAQEPSLTIYQGTSFTPELTSAGYALFRAGTKVSAGTCEDLAESLRCRHKRNGTRWRLLSPLAQAVLVIAFLRTNLTYAELAAGFGISPATAQGRSRPG
jgi:hypothetical protein